jgi:hypothetical protein
VIAIGCSTARPLSIQVADLLAGRIYFLHEIISGEHANRPLPILRTAKLSRLKEIGNRSFQRRNALMLDRRQQGTPARTENGTLALSPLGYE